MKPAGNVWLDAAGYGRWLAEHQRALQGQRHGLAPDYVQRLRGEETPAAQLTPRQREVLQLIAEGHSTKEIARRLDLSVKPVDTHRSQLMRQLDIHEVAGLVRHAMRIGLIDAGF